MKNIILLIIGIVLFYMFLGSAVSLTIPDEALRIRVIPNSNDEYDQKIKNEVKNIVQTKMYNLLKDVKGVKEARRIINNNLSSLDNDINILLNENNYLLDYNINYGLNYFPEKKYKGIIYEEGYYESLVITLGDGAGDNWWCVLFPPLCLIEGTQGNDVEYTTYVKELIEKYL